MNEHSIVLYGSYDLPCLGRTPYYKYPDGISGSVSILPIIGAVVGNWAVNALLGGNRGTGDSVSGVSKDFVWLVMGLSEGEIEGIVDANGNTSDGMGITYRPLQGVQIDKTPIQNNNLSATFNFREENDDGSLKPNTAINFAYSRGNIVDNLALADDKNIVTSPLEQKDDVIAYERNIDEVKLTVNINPSGSRRYTDLNEYRYLEPITVEATIQSAPPGFSYTNLIGAELDVKIVRLVTQQTGMDGDYFIKRLLTDDLGYEYRGKTTVLSIGSSPSTIVLGGLEKYGMIDIDSQLANGIKLTSIVTSGYRYTYAINGTFTSLKVKISLILQRSDKQGNSLRTDIRFTISIQYRTGNVLSGETVVIDESKNARYPTETFFDYNIPVNANADEVILVVRRLTPPQAQEDGGQSGKQLKLVSITKQSSDRIAYLHTAIAYLQFPAKILQSSPQLWVKIAGIKVDIPTGCSVDYSGDRGLTVASTWNGLFYTPNHACADPAWIVWHLLTEPRYKLGIEEQYIDKFKLYEISTYNNQFISNGIGGTERRHLFNGVLGAGGQTNVIEMIKSVCASMNVRIYWNGSMLSFWQDRKEPFGSLPRILSNADVEEGKFSYTSLEYQNTTTVAKVTYQSIQDDWENLEEIIEDSKYIARYGYHTEEYTLLGETRRSAAIRSGRKIIADSLPTNTQISMVVRPHALFFNPGDVVQIADSAKLKIRYAGLISSIPSSSSIVPDHPVFILPGSTNLKLLILLPNGERTERNFTPEFSNNVCVSFSLHSPLTTIPNVGATWLIVDQQVPLQKYRIVSVEPDGEAQLMFKVSGITYDEDRYNYIETGLSIPDLRPIPRLPAEMTPIDGGTVSAPKTSARLLAIGPTSDINANASLLGSNSAINQAFGRSQQTSFSLIANWSPWEPPANAPGNYFSHYVVEYRVSPDAEWFGRVITTEPKVRWDNLGFSPFYSVRVATVSLNGKTSPFVEFGADIDANLIESASLASRQLSRIEESLYSTQDGVVIRSTGLENVVYGEVGNNDINSQESIIIQAILGILGRPANTNDLSNLLSFTTNFDDDLLWYQQKPIYFNVANAIASIPAYSTEFQQRYSGKTTSQILELIYNACFNRSTDPIGLAGWTTYYQNNLGGLLSKIGELVVEIIFAGSGNPDGATFRAKVSQLGLGVARALVVVELFIPIVNRSPTSSEINNYLGFSPFDYNTLASSIFGSLSNLATGNRAKIQQIYNRAFNREPEQGGWDYWTNRLDSGTPTPDLIVEMISAASGNPDGEVFKSKALKMLNELGFVGRSGGVVHRIDAIEESLLGDYNLDFEAIDTPRGRRNGEQGAIAALFGTNSTSVVDKNGNSRTVYSPVSPNSLILGNVSVGEITNNYGGIIRTIYGQFTQGTGFTSSILSILVGNTSNAVYGIVPNSPSVGNVAIAYGGVIGAIYSTSFDANKATTGILARLDSIDAKLIELETMITETIRGLELQVAELNEIIEEKNQQLAGLASQVNSLSSSLSSTQTALANALQTIEQLQNPTDSGSEP